MRTNVRTFLRDFASLKAKARQGEIIRIKDREGEFLFKAAQPNKSLLGVAKGRVEVHDDLTKPTLHNDDWRPSL